MKLVEMTPTTKQAFLQCLENPERTTVVLFYADWCPHCQMMKPEWEKTVQALKSKKKVQLAQVEHTNLKQVPAKYKKNLVGFPSIKKFKGGKFVSEFYGGRNAQELIAFATEP